MENEGKILEQLRSILSHRGVFWEEKRMFGGQCFLVDDKMCFGTTKGRLLVRIDPDDYSFLLESTRSEPMIHGNKIINGYLYVNLEELRSKQQIVFWIDKCLTYNPKAKASKK